jgi:hypothetical protein
MNEHEGVMEENLMSLPAFNPFPKMSRFTRDCIITEKIDGTNASILIPEPGESFVTESGKVHPLLAGSRTRWIFPDSDNFGFAQWVHDNMEALLTLGPGQHFGEWWGAKIQRTYNAGEKQFSLFNTLRWKDTSGINHAWEPLLKERFKSEPTTAPACCRVVPIIAVGEFSSSIVENSMAKLKEFGSMALEGYLNPEGIVIYHVQGGIAMKKTFENDVAGKG